MMTFSELKEAVKKSPRDCSRKEITEIRRALRVIVSAAATAPSFIKRPFSKGGEGAYSLASNAAWDSLWSLISDPSTPWGKVLFRADNSSCKYNPATNRAIFTYNSRGNSRRFVEIEDYQRELKLKEIK